MKFSRTNLTLSASSFATLMTGLPDFSLNLTVLSGLYANRSGAPSASCGIAVALSVFVAVKNGSQTVSKSTDQTLRPCDLTCGLSRLAIYSGVLIKVIASPLQFRLAIYPQYRARPRLIR